MILSVSGIPSVGGRMVDVYAEITNATPEVVALVAQAMEQRAVDKRQTLMREVFLDSIAIPEDASVVEIGSGTGAVCRALAARPAVKTVVGVDPSPVLCDRARALAGDLPKVRFVEGYGQATSLPDACYDVVMIYTTLCHVPEPNAVLAEAFRLLRPGGKIAIFDGDYATTSVA